MTSETLPALDLGGPTTVLAVTPIGASVITSEQAVTELLPDHTARTHHKNSPSKLPYLAECAGFTSDETGDKDAAEKGTQLHEYMDAILARYLADTKKPLLTHLNEYLVGIAIDESDRGLLVYCVRALVRWLGAPGANTLHEIKVRIHRGDGEVLTSGHLDVLIIFPQGTGLLLDYKFGWLPVKDAAINEQGIAYALGAFEAYPHLKVIGVQFIQPRLARISEALIKREDVPAKHEQLSHIIERAVYFQRLGFTPETRGMLQTGSHCTYCKHTVEGTCPARLEVLRAVATAQDVNKVLPTHIDVDAIDTPEKAALARYWVDRVEDFLEPVKKRAKELAMLAPDRKIGITLADGTPVVFKIQDKKFDRSLGPTLEVADALKEQVTLEQLLACSTLSLGKLEEIAAEAILETVNGAEAQELRALEEKHRILLAATPPQITKSAAAKEKATVRARYKERRLTKDQAKEQFATLLTVRGLLTRPDGVTQSLVRDKSAVKQITK